MAHGSHGSDARGDASATAAFAASMPPGYREAYDDDATALHSGIVARRGDLPCWVEAWREIEGRILALCVVADDQPGLVSRITAALVSEALDVVDAHAFTRTRSDGRLEAVDFFWVRRLSARGVPVALRMPDLDRIADAVRARITGQAAASEAPPIPTPVPPEAAPRSVRVRFEREASGAVVLTVQAPDRPGLLLALTGTLFRADVQIVGLRATSDGGAATDRFQLVELDGSSLSEDRMRALQPLVFEAIASTLTP